MFDVGFWELLLIGVVGLLVVGPERLPEFARTIGRWVGQAQRMVRTVRADIERELETENLRDMINQQEEQIQELKGIVSDVGDETEAAVGADTLSSELNGMQKELISDVAQTESAQPEEAGDPPGVAEAVEAGDKKP